MKLYKNGLLVVGMLLGFVTLAAAGEPNVGELTRELTGEKPAAERTPQQRDAVYAQVLGALMPDMASEDPGRRDGPQGTLERIAFHAGRPGAEADRAACSKAIAARLGPEVGPPGRVWLLRQLERIGRAEAVPQVARLLTDKDPLVRESARRALQKNPAKEANAALQKALGSADGPGWRVALINALAERRDRSNWGPLLQEAAAANDDVRTAAVIGLAKLGDKSAAATIEAAMHQGPPRARRIAADCYLLLADSLAARGDKPTALEIYKNMLPSEGHLKCAAIIGLGRSGSAGDLPILFDALADPDARVRGACVEALCLLEGRDVTRAIAARARTAKPQNKPALLQALTRRGDKSTASVFMSTAADADEAVQVAALTGLGTVGNPTAVPVLLKAAAASGKPQEAARESLRSLPGKDIDEALLGSIVADLEPKIRVEAVRALGARHVVAATQALLMTAQEADAGVRNESLKALGVVASTDALAPLAAVLVKTADDGSRSEAAQALVSIANRERDVEKRSEPIITALRSAGGPARLSLLGVLGRIGGRSSLDAVRAAVKDPDEKVKDAAIRALTEWPDATAAADLLGVATSAAGETHQVLAVRGYLRVCSIRTDRPEAETAKMLAAGLEAARRPEEKRQALGGLAEVRDVLALQAVVPSMSRDALKEEAASAAVRIGRDVWERNPEAVKAAMQKVLEVSANGDLKREAKEVLDRAEQKLKEAKPKTEIGLHDSRRARDSL
jgi:HEAT repeat protein